MEPKHFRAFKMFDIVFKIISRESTWDHELPCISQSQKNMLKLVFRSAAKKFQLDCDNNISLYDLHKLISSHVDINADQFVLKYGFPPKLLNYKELTARSFKAAGNFNYFLLAFYFFQLFFSYFLVHFA